MKAHIFFHLVHFRYYWVQSSNKVIGSNMSMFWELPYYCVFFVAALSFLIQAI